MCFVLEKGHDGRYIIILAIAKKRVVSCTDEVGNGLMGEKYTEKVGWSMGKKQRLAGHLCWLRHRIRHSPSFPRVTLRYIQMSRALTPMSGAHSLRNLSCALKSLDCVHGECCSSSQEWTTSLQTGLPSSGTSASRT